jgi:Holliday junction resolvase RusA-like endonuclease
VLQSLTGVGSGPSEVEELSFRLPLPPSVNALYQKRRGGGLALSEKAKKFREDTKKHIAESLSQLLKFPTTQDHVYHVDISLFFESLENPGWFQFWDKDRFYTKNILFKKGPRKGQVQFWKGDLKSKKGERKAKSRYKEIDYDNRIKFLQDCVAYSLGIPSDAQIFRATHAKYEDPGDQRSEIVIRVIDSSQFFPKRGGSLGQETRRVPRLGRPQ